MIILTIEIKFLSFNKIIREIVTLQKPFKETIDN